MVTKLEIEERHLGKPGIIKLSNEDGTVDEIRLPQLEMNHYPKFMYIATKLQDGDLGKLSAEDYTILMGLFKESLKISPDLQGFSESQINKFIVANLMPVFNTFIQTNDLGASKSTREVGAVKRAESIEKIKETVNG